MTTISKCQKCLGTGIFARPGSVGGVKAVMEYGQCDCPASRPVDGDSIQALALALNGSWPDAYSIEEPSPPAVEDGKDAKIKALEEQVKDLRRVCIDFESGNKMSEEAVASRDARIVEMRGLLERTDRAIGEEARTGYHGTYNGGHHEEGKREAFHHGMDTVFNSLQGTLLPSIKSALSLKPSPAEASPECPNCKERKLPCRCMKNKCVKCGESVGNVTFTRCDKCWEQKLTPPSPLTDAERKVVEAARKWRKTIKSPEVFKETEELVAAVDALLALKSAHTQETGKGVDNG